MPKRQTIPKDVRSVVPVLGSVSLWFYDPAGCQGLSGDDGERVGRRLALQD